MSSHYTHLVHQTTDFQSGFDRTKVDAAQTSFFEGREFRSFLELTLAAGASQVIKVESAVPFILFGQELSVSAGELRLAPTLGGTEGGSYSVALPVIGKNRLPERRAPYYESQVVLSTGGTHTGGTEVEVVHIIVAGATGQRSTVGASMSDERGLPAGTYYLRFTNPGASQAKGVYSLWWEERARHPAWD